ncbi:MAG: hypothetical protein CMP50_03190 [Flavobacteriales bacterium]|nr:hypothetical protein [Flavobacteriales bacterium]|tara:strand:- start:3110 stop:4432 length:1323 start_codon:yes stop_codon:yes gene_type:complete
MCIYACAIGFATFIENDYGTTAARALVFNSWWMELILVFLCSIFMYNIFQYKLYHLRKVPVLFLHLSFIFIIIGAGITRYVSEEGVMRIREGSLNNQFISSNQFLEFKIHDGEDQYLGQKELLPSSITNNKFTIPVKFKHHQIKIEYIDFIHDPVDKLVQNVLNGSNILELIIPSSAGGMQSEYILENTQKNINNLSVSFNLDLDSELHIFKEDSAFYFVSKYDVEFMKMSNQAKGVLVKNTTHKFNKKTLYTVLDKNLVFKNDFNNAILKSKSFGIKNDDTKLDLLKIKLSVFNQDTIVDLYGSKGTIASKQYFKFNNLFFSLSYGSRIRSLPFGIFLKDFQLERYPGSDSPSSFASEIQVLDGDTQFDYRIFMNNVLNYKGYRFFQSSYDPDEKGTILSVNKDKLGTGVTYFGYLSLLLSVLSLMLSRFSRINILNRQ